MSSGIARANSRIGFSFFFALDAFPESFLPMTLEKVIHGLDAELDRIRRPVFVHVLEREVRCAGALHDLLDNAVDRGVVAAFETGELDGD